YSTASTLTEDDVVRMLKNKFPKLDFHFNAPGELELLSGGNAEAKRIADWLRGLDVEATASNQFVEIPQLSESAESAE
ncbi:hypothetical protein, partial [Streptococcus pneumoniae]|uniref:hypothetical protein n=1 Tax=Streptococcus pneumoniae TaxID=1313 RepID=UPI0018B02AC0